MHWVYSVFGPDNPHMLWWQMAFRAALLFAVGIGLIRMSGQRTFSHYSALDTIVTVLIGSNLSRALTGGAELLPTIVGRAVIVILHRSLAHLSLHSPFLARMLKGTVVGLVNGGELSPNMARQAIGEHDLREAMRLKGFDDVSDIGLANLERNGQISLLKR